ncbi:hypothetical protein AB4212_69830, partial [Streptomyces sp. 2MCAF27]
MSPYIGNPATHQLPAHFASHRARSAGNAGAREPAHIEVSRSHYRNLVVELDPADKTYWCYMQPQGRPSFTPDLLNDISDMQRSIQRMFAERSDEDAPVRYFVFASGLPGIYS